MIIRGSDVLMTRGDSESLTISLTENGVPKLLTTGDTVYFTIKRTTATDRKTLQKVITEFVDGSAIIAIEHDDTKELSTGTYWYDIQITFVDGTVTTIIGPSKFYLLDEVTYE